MFGFNKKPPVQEKAISPQDMVPPVIFGNGDTFYPITREADVNDAALVAMYNTLPEVQIPINYLIGNMSNIKFNHVKLLSDGTPVVLKNSYQMKTLSQPNQFDITTSLFIKRYFLNKLVLGTGYVNRIEGLKDMFTQLYVLPTASTSEKFNVVSKKDMRLNSISSYVTDFGFGQIELAADTVVADREATFYSLANQSNHGSRLMSAIAASDSLRYNYEAKVKLYKDRGALGIISPREGASLQTKTAADKIRSAYYSQNGITTGKDPFLFTTSAVDYVPITFDAASLQLSENRISDFNIICSLMGVDSVIFGVTASTFSNKEWAEKDFWLTTAMPTFNSFLQFLAIVFNLPKDEAFLADYNDIAILQSDNKDKVSIFSTMFKDGVITKEEYRKGMNIDKEK